MRSLDDVGAALVPWFAARLDADDVSIADLRRHAEGWSWQTYTATVNLPNRTLGLAIRRQPEDGLLAPYDLESQYRLHRAVEAADGVPVPALLALELDPEWIGLPFYVMERIEGGVPVQWGADDPQFVPDDEARRHLGEQFVDILAAIHRIDPVESGLPIPHDVTAAIETELDRWERDYEESVRIEVPLLRAAFGWLRRNPRPSERTAVCHGDYRIGNFAVRDGVIDAIYDWELASVTDPVSDLAWAGLPLFRGRSPRFSHLLERKPFLARYQAAAGWKVDDEVFDYWTVFGLVRAAVPHLRAAHVFETGAFDDLRLAAMGHQVTYVLKALRRELPSFSGAGVS